MKELTENEALQKAAAYCSGAEHCRSEVARKLEQWGVAPAGRDRILAYLLKEKYIDETRFCRAFVHDKSAYNKWGRTKIGMALRQKQIDDALIHQAVSELASDDYQDQLKKLLAAKAETLKTASPYEKRNKLIRFALSRGFEAEFIFQCLDADCDDCP